MITIVLLCILSFMYSNMICFVMLLIFIVLYIRLVGYFFFFQAEDGIRDTSVTGVQTCALPICGYPYRSTRSGIRYMRRAAECRSARAYSWSGSHRTPAAPPRPASSARSRPTATDRKSVV